MPEFWIPSSVTQATGDYVEPGRAFQDGFEMVEWGKRLKALDPRLRLLFVPPLDPDKPTPWPKGMRWYVVRHNDLADDTFWIVEDEHGNYSPFTQRHFDKFQENDTWAHPERLPNAVRAMESRRRREKKAQEEKHREFREKLLERLNFNYERSVPVTGEMKDKLDAGLE